MIQNDLEKELNDYPVKLEIPVQWGEMDAARHVNNVVYLRWFETARIEYFTRLGQDVLVNGDLPGFILAWQDCKYLFPVTFPDTVIVAIRTTEIMTDRFKMHCKMASKNHQRLVAIGHATIVSYDYHHRHKVEIPREWRILINNLENRDD